MNTFNYLLQTNLYLVLFFGFYILLLRNETFFKQNRVFLNGGVLLSFVIPFINSSWFRELFVTRKVREATELIPVQMIYDPVQVQIADTAQWTAAEVINLVYLSGAAIFLTRFIIQLVWLNYDLKERRGAAFSFFRKLVVDSELAGKDTIIRHEKVHIRQWHSLDVLVIELAAIINWFNPVMYLYKKEVKYIHEFIADEEVCAQQSKSEYAALLLSNTLGINPNQLINSFFNQSLLKRRIIMLGRTRSRRVVLLKYGLAAPLFAVMLILSAAAAGPYHPAMITASQKISNSLTAALSGQDEPGDYKSFLKRNPEVKELAWKINPYRVIVYLKNGRTETYNMDNRQEKEKALSKYGELPYPPPPPPAKPSNLSVSKAKQSTVTLNNALISEINDQIKETLKYSEINREAKTGQQDHLPVDSMYSFSDLDVLPEFPVSQKAFGSYLAQNIRYPEKARENQISGKVFVSFVVEKDGTLADMKVLRGLGHGTDEEAIRILKNSPRWKPGVKDGRAVRVQYTLPISFQITKTVPASLYDALFSSSNKYDGLIFIDEKEVDASGSGTILKQLTKDKIESITVLKGDDAIKQYGERGKKGVLVIKTKH